MISGWAPKRASTGTWRVSAVRHPSSRSLLEFPFGQHVDLLVDAAERLQAAVAAGHKVLLRVAARLAARERLAEPLGLHLPVAQQRLPRVRLLYLGDRL